MKEFFRSNKVAGLMTGTIGLAMLVFGAFALVIIAFQRLMISATPPSQDADFNQVVEMMATFHRVLISYLPSMMAGGLVFGVAGFYVYRGSLIARRIAQTNAVVGFIWIIAYTMTSYRVMESMLRLPFYQKFPIYQNPVFQWGTIIVNLIIMFVFPITLLYILRRPIRSEELDSETSVQA